MGWYKNNQIVSHDTPGAVWRPVPLPNERPSRAGAVPGLVVGALVLFFVSIFLVAGLRSAVSQLSGADAPVVIPQQTVESALAEYLHENPANVTCPYELKKSFGQMTQCTVTNGAGSTRWVGEIKKVEQDGDYRMVWRPTSS